MKFLQLMVRSLGAAALAALAACAPIEKQETLVEGSAATSTVGVGDIVAKVQKTRDLKNAFGAADIWGRKTNEGFAEVRFAGVESDGTVVLFRRDLAIETDEDVFTRSGFGMATTSSSGNATISGNAIYGSGTSTTLVAHGRDATTIPVPTGTFPIRVPPGVSRVPFEGRTIEILDAQPLSLTYRIMG